MITNTEKIFTYIDNSAEKNEESYLEGIIEACTEWLEGNRGPDQLTEPVTQEEIRRGLQLNILKGMKMNVQANHQMTPDALGMLIGHMVKTLLSDKDSVTLLDPAAGTGNLLYTVMNMSESEVQGFAVEIDDVLVRLAAAAADLLSQPVTFFVQDALRPLFIDPVDAVVCDLPVGYYPDDDNAMNYSVMPAEGHAFAHHLFIEQSIQHLRPGGFAFFLIPSNLFDEGQPAQLHTFLKKETIIRAVIQLPASLFKHSLHEKSILILQKPAQTEKVIRSSDVLLAKVPSMTQAKALSLFLQKFDDWAEEIE